MEKSKLIVDEEMLVRLKTGDSSAFDFFYKKYRGRIYANVLKMVKSSELASDLLQETFVTIWHNRDYIDPKQPIEHYIFRIAQNKVYDFFRKASRDKKLEEQLMALTIGEEYNPIEDAFHLKENFDLLEQQIEQLPPKCREVFKLCKLDGKSYNEVGLMLNISPATVNNHIVKATSILKKNLSHIDFMLIIIYLSFFK